MRPRDLADEVGAAVVARPARSALTVLGTVLGVAALVATLGLSSTAGGQIVASFDELRATQVIVTPKSDDLGGGRKLTSSMPWEVEDRLDRLNGVRASGARAEVDVGDAEVRAANVRDPAAASQAVPQVVAASPGLLGAVRGRIDEGRWFDAGHSTRADRVVVMGSTLAERLGIHRLERQPSIRIGDEAYVVIGVLGSVERETDLLSSVILPWGTAAERFRTRNPDRVVIDTRVGAAALIAEQAPTALAPNDPSRLTARRPAEPDAARQRVRSDVDALFLVLGGVSLVIGAVGIANMTLVSVMERVGEIGLRRALGARRSEISAQFLGESAALGLAGGVVGTVTGLVVVVVVSLWNRWNPILDVWVPLVAPAVGLVVGLAAGIFPARRAARLQPVEALRAG